ncbi:Rv2175c family DNA-binding protein [Pseudonocardia nematodicida]|uniref:Rv2175c family DNA-binding protein n=1 Tax=Pseudonocardia nematodicida TaxID=1206997 RepID=A0ABV1KCN6_9PSEU
MSESLPAAVTEETLPVSEAAARLSVPTSRVHQLVRDGQLLSLRHDGEVVVPAAFLVDGDVVRGLSGTIMVMRDGGYDDRDILRWLFTDDESLPGSPIGALRAGRQKEVKRRAQAMAF